MTASHIITAEPSSEPFKIQLPMTARSVPLARNALREAMIAWRLDSGLRADVLLVASELGANAVTHARKFPDRQWQLIVVPSPETIRVEVADGRLRAPSGIVPARRWGAG